MKKIIVGVVIVFMIGGCVNRSKTIKKNEDMSKFSPDEKEEVLLDYLGEKYQKDFEIITGWYTDFSNTKLEVNIRDTHNDKDAFSRVLWTVKDGREGITDNYAYYLYRPNINIDVDEMIGKVLDSKIEFASFSDISGDGKETTFDINDYYDFMNKNEGYRVVSTTIIFKDELTKQQLEGVAEKLRVEFERTYGKNVYYNFYLRVDNEEWFEIHSKYTKEYKDGNGALYSDLYHHLLKSEVILEEYSYHSPARNER